MAKTSEPRTLDRAQLHELFSYRDGQIFWRPRPYDTFATLGAAKTWHKRWAGKRAGVLNAAGYRYVSFSKQRYLEHRIIYAMHYAEVPDLLDHANHDSSDNRVENLRPASRVENGRNRVAKKRSTSRYLGVSWYTRDKMWSVQTKFGEKRMYLGRFESETDAAVAYDTFAKANYGEFAKLNFPGVA